MSLKFLFISLISFTIIWDFASPAAQTNDFEEIKWNLTELSQSVHQMKALLLEINDKFDQLSERKKSEVTSRCTSLCESKAQSLLNETSDRFKKHLDFCLNNSTQKALNSCDPNPCINGGECEVIRNGSDYRCNDCPIVWTGDKCQNLSCVQNENGKCFQRDNTVYYAIDVFDTWESSQARCVRQGMSLALPKDEETSEYLAQKLRSFYGSDFPGGGLWLGLRSEAGDRKFQWTDGSALGNYTGGLDLSKAPADYSCVSFSLHNQEQLWDASKCSFHLFPFCEKRISVQ